MKSNVFTVARRGLTFPCVLFLCGALALAQAPQPPLPPDSQSGAQPLDPNQLDNLVAPIALYPDPLLSQVLAASTYPLELVEAQQWLQQNRNLSGTQLMDAARQQNWDPSVQALVAFPDVLAMLNRDIRWTTDLGNAYLGQQNDVMAAVQQMRLRAEQNGRLASTPQQTVMTQAQNGQSAIVIEPANPQVIYVPTYNPGYIWGPPVLGYYPPVWYPTIGFGFGFGPGIFLGGFFPGWGGWGWGGWGSGWGWGEWFGGGLYVNNFFFSHYGFHGFYNGGFYRGAFPTGGREVWAHDPYHRAGIAYANQNVAARYNNARYSAGRFNGGYASSVARPYSGSGSRAFNSTPATRGFGPANQAGTVNPGFSSRSYNGSNYRGSYSGPSSGQSFNRNYAAPNYNRSYSTPSYNRGYSGQGFSGGRQSYAAPRSNGGFGGGSPSFSGGNRSFSGGGSSSFNGGGSLGGGHSFGGGGGHSGGGGGHSGGGRR